MRNDQNGAPDAAAGHDPTVIGVAIAGIVSVVVTEDDWDLFDSMIGLILVLVLLA